MAIEILRDGNFWVIALATILLGSVSGMVGTVSVLKGQSLIGDAVGHATFAGIVLCFMLFQQREPALLALGAFIAGVVAFKTVQVIKDHSSIKLDSLLALVLSSFFGLGMVLKSFIQGNPDYQNASQSGLQSYIFGQASYIMKADLALIVAVSGLALLALVIFYQPLKIFIFDEGFAGAVGINKAFYNGLILMITTLMIAVGLKAVGSILISSMLVAPAVCGLNWSDRFAKVLGIAGLVGGISAFAGTLMSSTIQNMPTGPAIIVVMSLFALTAIIFSKKRFATMRRKKAHGTHQRITNGSTDF